VLLTGDTNWEEPVQPGLIRKMIDEDPRFKNVVLSDDATPERILTLLEGKSLQLFKR
jgi:hypothetical protein